MAERCYNESVTRLNFDWSSANWRANSNTYRANAVVQARSLLNQTHQETTNVVTRYTTMEFSLRCNSLEWMRDQACATI